MKNALPVAPSRATSSGVFDLPTFHAFVYRGGGATPCGAGDAA